MGEGSESLYRQPEAAQAIQTGLKLKTCQRKPTQAFPQRLPHQQRHGRAGEMRAGKEAGIGYMFSLTKVDIRHIKIPIQSSNPRTRT